jgi:hypothetical protein
MVTRLEMAIAWFLLLLHQKLHSLRKRLEDSQLEAILADESMKWIRSTACAPKHKLEFAQMNGAVHGAARALGVSVDEFVTQLFDQGENDEAMVLGLIAKHSARARGPNK